MCYCSIEIRQFQTLKTQSERHAIELLFKVQISPHQPTSNTNERGIFKSIPCLGNFTVLSMEFPITNCLPFLFQTNGEFLSDNLVAYSRKMSKQITDKKNRCHKRIKALRVLMETMSCDFSSCRLSRVHFCR